MCHALVPLEGDYNDVKDLAVSSMSDGCPSCGREIKLVGEMDVPVCECIGCGMFVRLIEPVPRVNVGVMIPDTEAVLRAALFREV